MIKATTCFTGGLHVFDKGTCSYCGKTREQVIKGDIGMPGSEMPVAFIRMDLGGISDANLREFTKFLEEGWNHALEEGRPMVIGTNMQLYYRHEGKYYSLDTGESRGSGEGL